MHTTRMLIMGLFALLMFANCGSSPAVAQNEEAAKEAAQEWLALIDAGDYAESWEKASGFFRAAMAQEQWQATLENIFAQLGTLKSRDLIAAKYTTSLPNAPEGEYVLIQYSTMYGTSEVVETVTMQKDGEAWKAAGYFVNPS